MPKKAYKRLCNWYFMNINDRSGMDYLLRIEMDVYLRETFPDSLWSTP